MGRFAAFILVKMIVNLMFKKKEVFIYYKVWDCSGKTSNFKFLGPGQLND